MSIYKKGVEFKCGDEIELAHMPLGRLDSYGDHGHETGTFPTVFDRKTRVGGSTLIDGRPLSIKSPRDARQPTIEGATGPSSDQSSDTTPHMPR